MLQAEIDKAWDAVACKAFVKRMAELGVHIPRKPKMFQEAEGFSPLEALIRRIDPDDYRYLRLLIRIQRPAIVFYILDHRPLAVLDSTFRLGGYEGLYDLVTMLSKEWRAADLAIRITR